MSLVELIGFAISLLALIFIFLKQQSQTRRRQEHPEGFKEDELDIEDPLKELIKAMEMEQESELRKRAQHVPPPPPPSFKEEKRSKQPLRSPLKEYQIVSEIEKRQLKSSLENRHLKPKVAPHHEEVKIGKPSYAHAHHIEESRLIGPSRAQKAIKRLSHRRDLIIYQEIVDKPKSLRPYS